MVYRQSFLWTRPEDGYKQVTNGAAHAQPEGVRVQRSSSAST
jgi:hypothetical protein